MSDSTTGKTVRRTVDPSNLPPLTEAEKAQAEKLAAMPDEDIDFSDIPRTPDGVLWTHPGALVSTENKQQITLRLDAEVVAFFKQTGKRYQSRINEVLKAYVQAHRHEVR